MKKEDLKKFDLNKLDHKLMLIFCAVVFVVCGVLVGVFENIAVLNAIFVIIALVAGAGAVYAGIKVLKNRLEKQREKNFTCQSCGKKFEWNEDKIVCAKIYEDIKANNDCKGFSYWYVVRSKWTCECGHENDFKLRFCFPEPHNSEDQLIHDYYLGKVYGSNAKS